MSIPASSLVTVNPGVLSAGGNPLNFNGVILTENVTLPTGAPTSFPSADSVAAYFGATSIEAKMAAVYFSGYINGTRLPLALMFARYPATALAAFINGGPAPTLATAKLATAGQFHIVMDSTPVTVTAIDLSSAASLAAVALDVQTALRAALVTASYAAAASVTVTYNSTIGCFVITSGTTGASSAITYASITGAGANDLATVLGLTAITGATLSQGANVDDPTTFMNALILSTQNWVSFGTTFLPSATDMEAFSSWTNAQDGRYLYVAWDNDATAAGSPGAFTGFGKWLYNNQPSGTAAVWAGAGTVNGPLLAAFVMGVTASINFNQEKGRISYAFKGNANLTPEVTDLTTANNLIANGYSFYGDYATANQQFLFFNNGQLSGDYLWIDPYVDAIWLNNALQLALMTLFSNVNALPYNTQGYTMIETVVQGIIQQALFNGVIVPGVTLSAGQIAIANSQAGTDISSQLQNQGYFFQVVPVTDPTVRAARQSPVCNLWYTDGGSIQQITLASIDIQ